MGHHSTKILAAADPQTLFSSKKRKREQTSGAEIEVDISAPEPPSKKALRKAKKGKHTPVTVKQDVTRTDVAISSPDSASREDQEPLTTQSKRSDYGIWIGNLPWTATKLDLRSFFTKDTDLEDGLITRIHMPPPNKSAIAASRQRIKPQNQGFAYVDFSNKTALAKALALSEKLLTGRRVLIKDANSFEGRPTKPKEENAAIVNSAKPRSKRIFVGNLGFDTTKATLQDHFARCGEILNVHVATFEDTGKCKGYAWVEFAELEAGEAAVRGWVKFEENGDVADEDEEITQALADQAKPKKKPRLRKWWVNKLGGRPLRMEFAEGKDIRYKKRYGKDGSAREEQAVNNPEPDLVAQPAIGHAEKNVKKAQRRFDARKIKPGAALAAAPRNTGSIVESQGKKITFD